MGASGREGHAKPAGAGSSEQTTSPPLSQARRVLLYQLSLVPLLPLFLEREISKVAEAAKASPGII